MEEQANFSGNSAQDTILAVKEAKAWLEAVTEKKLPETQNFRQALESGVLLCEFMEKLRPNSITKINRRASAIAHLDNIKQFLSACEAYFGLRDGQLFEITDLQDLSARKGSSAGGVKRREADRRIRNVCVTLYWLGRALSCNDDYVGPQLCLEAFENMMSGEDIFGSDEYPEGLQEVTVHMTTSSGGFGFQIVGGHDCSVPATVDRVVVGGVAESRGLQPNDIVVSINGEDITQLSHLELIRFIKQCGSKGSVVLGLLRRASFREFSPLSDNNYRSSSDSPLPNIVNYGSPLLVNDDAGRRQSEEHIAKSEILVHSARIANKVYVGDSSGEESDNATHNSKNRANQVLHNNYQQKTNNRNREDEESLEKQRKDQELRRKQEEEMAQVYPTKYSWANGKSEKSSVYRGESNSSGAKVFDVYGGNMGDSPVGARASKEKLIELENELKDISFATSHIRQKWHKEENRAVSLSPVLSRKQKDALPAGQKQRILSDKDYTYSQKHRLSGTDDQALQVLEQQLQQLQLEAKLAREEAEALKREKADDEARIRREEQVKYQEELKRQSIDAQQMLTELQKQQLELQETLKQAKNFKDTEMVQERDEIKRQLDEQRKVIVDEWQQLDKERKLMEEKRRLIRQEEEQARQAERQIEIDKQLELERLQVEEARKKVELEELQEKEINKEQKQIVVKRDSWKPQTELSPEVEQRRESERRAEMQRQMERLQKKEQRKSPSSTTFNQMSQMSPNSTLSYNSSVFTSTATSFTNTTNTVTAVQVPKQAASTHSHQICACCNAPLGYERAMAISNLGLMYHLKCFVCCVCHAPLATGLERTGVLIRNSQPHCKYCYSTDSGLLATEC